MIRSVSCSNRLSEIALARISQRFVQRIPIHFARRHTLIGLETADQHVIEIAAPEAAKQGVIDNLALTLACETQMIMAESDAIQRGIDAAYQQQRVDIDGLVNQIAEPDELDVEALGADGDLLDNASRAPVIKLVNLMLFEAVRKRASDAHIQPTENGLVIRLRIDGVLFDYLRPPKHLHDAIVSRIKVMGGMDIAEKRLPQDGRATVRVGQRLIDLRISSIPTAHGERVVLRLLDKGARLYELSELGMAADVLAQLRQLIGRSHGMLLMTGPTGSGKSTTLYSALQEIDYAKLNVVTLEDPIEYQLPGISQTQVSSRKGLTFATGLRSVLRQDPDVIMVGEIRDEPTARLAIQSALTGHLVLSTLHTNDAAGAVARLLDLGVEPYLVADSLLGVGAQRLVRLNCPRCTESVAVEPHEARELGLEVRTIQRGAGCEYCGETGYYDRQAICELLVVDQTVRGLIHDRAQASTIRGTAVSAGMRSLRADGVQKVLAGLTTPAEVLRVTQRYDQPIDQPAAEV